MPPKADFAAWAFPSSSGTTVYETVLETDGTVRCNCPGWVFFKKSGPRSCKHTKMIEGHAKRMLAGTLDPALLYNGKRLGGYKILPMPAPEVISMTGGASSPVSDIKIGIAIGAKVKPGKPAPAFPTPTPNPSTAATPAKRRAVGNEIGRRIQFDFEGEEEEKS